MRRRRRKRLGCRKRLLGLLAGPGQERGWLHLSGRGRGARCRPSPPASSSSPASSSAFGAESSALALMRTAGDAPPLPVSRSASAPPLAAAARAAAAAGLSPARRTPRSLPAHPPACRSPSLASLLCPALLKPPSRPPSLSRSRLPSLVSLLAVRRAPSKRGAPGTQCCGTGSLWSQPHTEAAASRSDPQPASAVPAAAAGGVVPEDGRLSPPPRPPCRLQRFLRSPGKLRRCPSAGLWESPGPPFASAGKGSGLSASTALRLEKSQVGLVQGVWGERGLGVLTLALEGDPGWSSNSRNATSLRFR